MSRRSPFLILVALWMMVFVASSQVIIIAPILPRIGAALQVSEALLGLLGTSYALLLTIFALITGPISDKIGRRAILLIGCGFMAVALALHGLADTFWMLLTMRGLAGAAAGVLSGAAVAYVGDYFPYDRRGWATGWIMSGIAFGQILGIPVGTILADQFDFRVPFVAFAGVMALTWMLVWFFVPQPDMERDPHPLNIRRAVTNYGALMRQRAPAAGVASYFLMFTSFGLYVFYLPTWLENDVGLSGTQVATLFLVGGLANVVASPVSGRLSDLLGRKPLIITSCIGISAVMTLTTFLVTDVITAYLLFGGSMVLVAMRMSPLHALMTAIVPGARRGILMSLAIAIGQLGFGFGSAIAGITYSEQGYFSSTVAASIAMALMAIVVWMAMPEPGRKTAVTPEEHNVASIP